MKMTRVFDPTDSINNFANSGQTMNPQPFGGGFSIRSNVTAGVWQCQSCAGQVQGSQMINPTCAYCVLT
jgi:hypothetical protein